MAGTIGRGSLSELPHDVRTAIVGCRMRRHECMSMILHVHGGCSTSHRDHQPHWSTVRNLLVCCWSGLLRVVGRARSVWTVGSRHAYLSVQLGLITLSLKRSDERSSCQRHPLVSIIDCDNLSSVRVANDIKSSSRVRHALRRYAVLQQRVRNGDCVLRWTSDASNPSNFLTKFIPKKKLDASIAYTQGAGARLRAATEAALAEL